MLVLTGRPGSGKTSLVLSELADSIRRQDGSVRLLVPTAAMAGYLRQQIAREGLAFRPRLIQTIHQFADGFAEGAEVSRAALHFATQAAVDRLSRPEFAAVAGCKGFLPMLAASVEEILSTGGGSREAPLHEAVAAVAGAAGAELEKRGLRFRTRRLTEAARTILRDGLGSIHTVWLDGFSSLAGPELDLALALSRHADVTVTLPEDAAVPDGCRVRKLETVFRRPTVQAFRAPSPGGETAEIARRILAEAEAGRAFRDIGVIARDRRDLAAIESALDRFSIPHRIHAGRPLSETALGRFCRAVLDALRSDFEHEAVIGIVSRSGIAATDEFDFAVRRQLPGAGIEALRSLPGAPVELLDQLAGTRAWIESQTPAAEWAARMRTLPLLMASRSPAGESSFDAALEEIAAWYPPAAGIEFEEFARSLIAALECAQCPVEDRRRNAVHVLTAYDAMHWELPVVFVCGLVEGRFPRHRGQDPFLPDGQSGRAEDLDAERRLFDTTIARATSALVLSYARSDARGGANQPSRFLDGLAVADCGERLVRTRPVPACQPGLRAGGVIRDREALAALETRHATLHPSGVETYLRCPFQFFGRYSLHLETRPARPEDRLDFKLQGTILHDALAASAGRPSEEIYGIFDRVFRKHCLANAVAPGYRAEFLRRQMLEDVRRFLSGNPFPQAERTIAEARFELPLAAEVTIRGRIDRIDIQPDGRGIVIDYKRTAPETDAPALAQAPLYALAAERVMGIRPAGVFYCGLRERVRVTGWSAPDAGLGIRSEALTAEWLDEAERKTIDVARRIRAGRFEPAPVTEDLCARCEYRDVCRYQGVAIAAAAATDSP